MSRSAVLATRWVVAAAILAAVAGVSLPDPPRPLDPALQPGDDPMPPVIAGAFHVHTDRSDGSASVAEVAAAAGRAGLSFVVVTDHGDGTRAPDPPTYYDDVLVLDGVEVRTSQGHYLAVGQGQAPYPLGGAPQDVVDDVRRLGGFGVAAHPGSPKDELRWHAWSVGIDGLEWLNGDSAWRDESWYRLGLALLQYPMRAPAAIAALFERPVETLLRWDGLTQRRRVVGRGRGGCPRGGRATRRGRTGVCSRWGCRRTSRCFEPSPFVCSWTRCGRVTRRRMARRSSRACGRAGCTRRSTRWPRRVDFISARRSGRSSPKPAACCRPARSFM